MSGISTLAFVVDPDWCQVDKQTSSCAGGGIDVIVGTHDEGIGCIWFMEKFYAR